MKRKLALLGAVAVLATAGLSGSALATTPDSSPAPASGSALATTSGSVPVPALAGQPGCEAVAIKLEDGSTVRAVPATPVGEASAGVAEPAETVRLETVTRVVEPAESVRPEALADVPESAGTVRLDDVEFAEARPALPVDGEPPVLPGKSVAVTCLKR